ncbi:MAG TPA: VWA domain-containing protein, partial [Enhygromyxa sp.]|nr:VWA domain-containing protein [Enhygromyxa sp.]
DASGRATLHARIDDLEIEGGTNIEAGLELGYASVAEHRDGPGGREDRLMLFTDAQPNIGATDPSSFVGQARAGAAQGVGISAFGVGLDLGAALAREVSETRGGNSFYLADAEAIATVFDHEFEYIVTPVAYSLHFEVRPALGFSFVDAYGTPDADASGEVEVSIATVFLSRRGGAMAVLLDGDLSEVQPGESVVSFALDYQSLDGEPGGATLEAEWLGGDFPIGESGLADSSGSAKLAVLLDEFLALEAAAAYCEGALARAEAIRRIDEAAARLEQAAALLDDAPLREELKLMQKLSANVAADGC